MDIVGLKTNEENISFTRNEWRHFVDEVEMRNGREIQKCVNNARYLAMLDVADEQIKNVQVVVKTLEELEAME